MIKHKSPQIFANVGGWSFRSVKKNLVFAESSEANLAIEYRGVCSKGYLEMATLTLEADTDGVSTSDYVVLGLKDSRKDNIGKPQILSLLSTLLDRSVRKNERILETSQTKDVITIFHGLRAPSLSIQKYIDRIFKYSCCSSSCFIIAYIYMERFVQRTNLSLNSLNIHRLLITSVMVAAKFMDDAFFNNAYYARVGGISTAELNKLEMKFLFSIDFRLHVSIQTFGKYCSMFRKEASDVPIERCGVEESWSNKDDSTHARSTAR